MITKKAFTLIELIVVILIIAVLMLLSYAPYNYFQNKAKLKNTTREVSQLLYESRNMALNWSIWSVWNVTIGVYFDTSSLEKNKIKVFSYPFDIDELNIINIEWWDIKLVKTLILQKWIQLDSIESKTNFLFVFEAITGDTKYYSWDGWWRSVVTEDDIDIDVSFKWSTSSNLQKTITYFTNTNIIDY